MESVHHGICGCGFIVSPSAILSLVCFLFDVMHYRSGSLVCDMPARKHIEPLKVGQAKMSQPQVASQQQAKKWPRRSGTSLGGNVGRRVSAPACNPLIKARNRAGRRYAPRSSRWSSAARRCGPSGGRTGWWKARGRAMLRWTWSIPHDGAGRRVRLTDNLRIPDANDNILVCMAARKFLQREMERFGFLIEVPRQVSGCYRPFWSLASPPSLRGALATKQSSSFGRKAFWIAASRSLSSGRRSRTRWLLAKTAGRPMTKAADGNR